MRNGNQSKGVGFVCFDTIEETTQALEEMNGKWILSKPIYVKLSDNNHKPQLTTSNSPKPSIPSATASYPPLSITPMPYINIPTVYCVPTVMVPPPPNNFRLPIDSPNAQISVPAMREYSSSPSTTTQVNRQFYPYIRVKSDDQ